jgi:hypothetical protein
MAQKLKPGKMFIRVRGESPEKQDVEIDEIR